MDRDKANETLRAEIAEGAVAGPEKLAVAFAFRGPEDSYGSDLESAMEDGQIWQVIFVPFSTGEELGLPSEAEGSMPWVMAEGGPFAHIMVYGDPNESKE